MNRQTENEQLLVPEMKKRCVVAASQVLKTFLTISPYVSANASVTASEKRKKKMFSPFPYKDDERFTLEMYYILLSFVDCAPRPYGFFTLLLVPKFM